MNAVEIEEAVSALAEKPFDPAEFPFEFLTAFGNKEVTVKRLRTRSGNTSDVDGGVLQRNHIHMAIAAPGQVAETLDVLRASPKTTTNKARFILATDGVTLEAEDLTSGETIAPEYGRFANDFAFFLPLAGISTVKAIKNNPIDIKATGRLNKLYVELLKDNPDWGTPERRADLNQFMARLIFCFFAEDTGIFLDRLFTNAIRQMSDSQSGNTHEVLQELFKAMATPTMHEGQPDGRYRRAAGVKPWADGFPYVNGGLFPTTGECPKFSRLARSYLLRAGDLDWQQINPDIFGSMIQAVADDDERGELGMHYTSVPNILKVLNPLFLDDLRAELERAGDNPRMLRSLRKRMAGIRVFDPACGSGNFLVIAYKEMRAIEAEIVRRTGDVARSVVPLSNFYGIEIKGFAAEIARLALLIAEFQSDVVFIDQQAAKLNVLPLHKTGNIVTGNALRLDWLEVCPPVVGKANLKHDLGGPIGRLAFEGGRDEETYICGNPPYKGSTWQSTLQKDDLEALFSSRTSSWKSLDYVAGWFVKAADYSLVVDNVSAFVSTNSICQGQQVPILWPIIFATGREICFAHTSFTWTNLASNNAGVTVIVVGLSGPTAAAKRIMEDVPISGTSVRTVDSINAYLVPGRSIIVEPVSRPSDDRAVMLWGNKPTDGGNLILDTTDYSQLLEANPQAMPFLKRFVGSQELIDGKMRYCLWISDDDASRARGIAPIAERVERVATFRSASKAAETRPAAAFPHRFRQIQSTALAYSILVPGVSSENRPYLPVDIYDSRAIGSNKVFALYDAPMWNMALVASRLHWVWIGTVCVRLRTDFSYSNTLGWNTFPVPQLTDQNKADLTRCAEDILLAREAHFPATIADLYDPDAMPENLRAAHERNDETLERIYIGRRFRNDTERLEKLFELYTKMTANENKTKPGRKRGNGGE